MRIKNFLSCVCAASLVALSLVGCSDYDNGFTKEQLQFIQNFKEVFGEIDQTQDWNMAERGTVTVTTSKPSRIKIYANNFGSYKLVGDYEDVLGTRILGFDIVEGTASLLVSNGQTAQKVKVGDAVVFAGTRYAYTGVDTSDEEHDENECQEVDMGGDIGMKKIVEVDKDWTFFESEYVTTITAPNGILPEGVNNQDKVTDNFSYISTGPFKMFPIYAQTSSSHILGVYWKGDDNKIHTQHVYRTNIGSNGAGEGGTEYRIAEGGYESKGITINLPEGTQFGFYLEVYTPWPKFQHCVYSEAEMNKDLKGNCIDGREAISGINGTNANGDHVFAATFTTDIIISNGKTGTKRTIKDQEYLCFEDWDQGGGADLNDLVFTFTGKLPVIVNENAQSWILSCEDLGGSFDLDYNDVVIAVEHVSGHDVATVTPLAAGGTLASYIYFNDGDEDVELGEIHSFFGQDLQTPSGGFSPVNVDDSKPTMRAIETKKIAIKDPDNWSLSSFIRTTNNEMNSAMTAFDAKNKTMGGFYVKVLPEGKTSPSGDYNYPIIQNEVDPTPDNNVPYIICTPSTWTRPLYDAEGNHNGKSLRGDYRWPQEMVAMYNFGEFKGAAYDATDDNSKYSFRKWVENKDDANAKYWYAFPYSPDDNETFPNTCAWNAPRIVNSDTDLNDSNNGIGDVDSEDPDFHIVEMGDWLNYEDGKILLDLAKGDFIDGFYVSTITIVSKSGTTPAITTNDKIQQIGETLQYQYFEGNTSIWNATISALEDNTKRYDGFYLWTITFKAISTLSKYNFAQDMEITQEGSKMYSKDNIIITVFNDPTADGEPIEEHTKEQNRGENIIWGNCGYYIEPSEFTDATSVTLMYSEQCGVFYAINDNSKGDYFHNTFTIPSDWLVDAKNHGLYIGFYQSSTYQNVKVYIKIDK